MAHAFPADLSAQLGSQAQSAGLPAFSSLAMEEDVLFQGAPPLPRVDCGDAFDAFLQRWMSGQGQALDLPPGSQPDPTFPDALQPAPDRLFPHQLGRHQASLAGPQLGLPQQLPFWDAQQGSGLPPLPQLGFSQPGAFAGDAGLMPSLPPAAPEASPLAHSSLSMLSTEDLDARASHSALPQNKAASPGVSQAHSRDSGKRSPAPKSAPPELSTAAAKGAWTGKRRRGPTSEESKEKERARNRRAQKRFREREKERQEQRQSAMAALEAELAALTEANAGLEARNAALEQAAALRAGQACWDAKPKAFDPQMYVEAAADQPSDLLPTLTVGGEQRPLSQADAARMGREEHVRLYTAYVDELRQLLGEGSDEAEERMASLVRELCGLNLAVALAQPKAFADFQASRMDAAEATPEPTPAAVWQRCLAAVRLSADQRRVLLGERRKFLERMGVLLGQRRGLHALMQDVLAGPDAQRESHRKAMGAVERLRENLREEQIMLVQAMCATHQSILAPRQTAANIVTAFPYYPDVLLLADALAGETPGEPAAAELMGGPTLPPPL